MNNYQLTINNYPLYKDSGVEWLGDVPEHWELRRLKDISQITRGAILRPVDNPSYFDENGEWYYLNISDVTKCDKFLYTAKLKLSELGSRKSARVLPNNIILTASATIGKPTINKVKVCVHDGFIPFKQIQCNIIYLYYFLLNSSIYNALGKSNTQKNIYLDEVKTVNIAVPSQAEQKAIADYLDTKTAQIDRKIDLLSQKAKLYSNLKQSLINETVTRGLNKSLPMKDSGVEWIGKVPEHWKLKRLKDIGISIIGITYVPEDALGDKASGLLVLRSSNIQNGQLSLSDTVYVNKKINPRQIVRKGDILICSRNGSRALIGKNICIDERTEGQTFGAFMTVYRSKYFRFISKFFNSNVFESQSGLFGSSTINQLTVNTLNNFLLILPPPDEQKAIADYLDTKTAQIDQIIQTINAQIEKLKELRKTLINDVVTGKIKVIE
jgi:type I restriction enzyme S subunit